MSSAVDCIPSGALVVPIAWLPKGIKTTAPAEFKPHAAVLDIGMHGMSGYALADEIRRAPWGGEVTLIAVTGYSEAEDLARSRAAGFARHLTKPVAIDQLLELLARRGK